MISKGNSVLPIGGKINLDPVPSYLEIIVVKRKRQLKKKSTNLSILLKGETQA